MLNIRLTYINHRNVLYVRITIRASSVYTSKELFVPRETYNFLTYDTYDTYADCTT
jgi:hypothetical protein